MIFSSAIQARAIPLNRSMHCVTFVGFLLLVACGFTNSVFAQATHELSVAPVLGVTYPAGRWLPLRIELRNNTDATVNGAVRIPVTLPQASSDIRIPAMVPPHSKVALMSFGFLPDRPLALGNAPSGTGATPVAIAEWIASDGARLARADVLGQPDTAEVSATTGQAQTAGALLLSVIRKDFTESRETHRLLRLTEHLAGHVGYPLNAGECEASVLPRHVAGYDAVLAVVLNGVSPDSLDPAQRLAIYSFLLKGGNVVLPAPLGEADPSGSWLQPYLPVQIIGHREASGILPLETASTVSHSTGPTVLKFRSTLEICEAIGAGGEVIVQDANYVHAATKRVGRGKIVFTSFPISALDTSDPRTLSIWRSLLNLDSPLDGWKSSALGSQRDSILETMIGAPVPPWSRAAMIACGYVALMLLIQLLLPGARRPSAFVGGAGLAIGLFGLLIGVTSLGHKGNDNISAARLITVELGDAGGGIRREAAAFFGRDDTSFSITADTSASLRPAVTSADSPAIIEPLPFTAPGAGVRSGRVERVWEAEMPVSAQHSLPGTLQFTASGVKLQLDNQLGQNLLSPLLVWNDASYRLPDLQQGSTSFVLGPKNPKGDFTNANMFTGEEAGLRGKIVQLASSPPADSSAAHRQESPTIAGWLSPGDSGICGPILKFSADPNPNRTQAMLRSPVHIIPSPPGETVVIDPEFISMLSDAGQGVFYDEAKREWTQSIQTGTWNIAFAVPREIGRLKPVRVVISADLAAPGHTITLRRGQCVGGVNIDNPDGAIVAEWKQVVGVRAVEAALNPDDADATGRLWLRMSVEESGSDSNAGVLAQWKFNALSVGITAKVDSGQ